MTMQSPSSIAIVIASKGRPVELGRWTDHIMRQTIKPVAVVFSVTSAADLPGGDLSGITPLICDRVGLCRQRNMGLDAVIGCADIIAFFDDDYVPSSYCIEGIEALFATYPEVVAANGTLLADGINSPGISYVDALAMVRSHDSLPQTEGTVLHELGGLYGCNMVFRANAIGPERFDEELPLYAWQEDMDFAARVGKHGRMVKTNGFYGVHQGVKGGRLPGTRLGYSQIVNPIYLARKGTLSVRGATKLILKNFLKNHARSLFPEPWIDRFGRCKGNWLAIADVLLGRDHPKNILTLPR